MSARRWQDGLLGTFLVLWCVSCIRPPYPDYLVLQHIPTVPAVGFLILAQRRLGISLLSFSLLLAFLLLHILGARYLYSNVPYDTWCEAICGVNLTRTFGFTRNHYDRLVHVAYGVLLVVPALRFGKRFMNLREGWAAMWALLFIQATSATYEILEWLVAIILAPDWADSYNGQQGDGWDAQKDMLLASAGAIGGLAIAAAIRRSRQLRGVTTA